MSECVLVFNSEDIEKACRRGLVGGQQRDIGVEIREGGDADSFSVVWIGRWRRSGERAAGDAVSVCLRKDTAECVCL